MRRRQRLSLRAGDGGRGGRHHGHDREQFLRAMQEFAAEQNLGFHVSRKPVSKARRR
jgi:hypothetical protein